LAFLCAIVLNILANKETKERVRKRIKAELQSSLSAYDEYKATVGRLQRTYERKCELLAAQSQEESPPSSPESPTGANVPFQHIISGATSSSLKDTPLPPQKTDVHHALKASKEQINSLIIRLGGGHHEVSPSTLVKLKRDAEESGIFLHAILLGVCETG
jgi:hypothetical protein